MSAFRQMKTVMNDANVLVQVLKNRFAEVNRFPVPTQMKGWGARDVRNYANIIVPNKYVGKFNDLGFRAGEDGNYSAIYEDDNPLFTKAFFDSLSRDYQEEKTKSVMAAAEADLEEREELPDGGVRMRFYVNA